MGDTTFVSKTTKIPAAWCNEVNTLVHTILNAATTAAEVKTALSLVAGTDVQAYNALLLAIAGLTPTDGNIIVGDGSTFVAEAGAAARASLGLVIGTDVQAQADQSIIQVVEATTYTTYSSHTTVISQDDTIPQNTEGEEIITVAITPKSAANRLRITANIPMYEITAGQAAILALFQDSTASAVAVSILNAIIGSVQITYEMAAGTTSSTTFKLRVGPTGAATVYINGGSSPSRLFGGISAVRLRVDEIG